MIDIRLWRPWRRRNRFDGFALAALLAAGAAPDFARAQTSALDNAAEVVTTASGEDLASLSIEDLANVQITSMSKRPEALGQAAGAIFVITNDDIRRSGAVTVPEVLRLAPNLIVTQASAGDYIISARGFNGLDANNKLLVLIDGRTVYSPLHSQVFWDAQMVMLDDVDRIEVISGPGGTLWGANAVNGVINIITRHAGDTQGVRAVATLGERERDLNLRFGGQAGENLSYRLYAKAFDRGRSAQRPGALTDAYSGLQSGFRIDGRGGADLYTLQGDAYRNVGEAEGFMINGYNVLGRWTRELGGGASLHGQAYFDRAYRSAPGVSDRVNTWDAQVQYNTVLFDRHQVVLGGGYRYMQDRFVTTSIFFLDPEERDISIGNVFVQDDIALTSDLRLTLGLKIEDSSFSGVEVLPNARLAWRTGETGLLWGAISRAVRTPASVDRDLTVAGILQPARDFQPETLIAYEIGYRVQPNPVSSFSVSAYYSVYDRIRSLGLATDPAYVVMLANDVEGDIYGVEAWGDYLIRDWWRLSAGINLLRKDFAPRPGAVDFNNLIYAGNDPDSQAWLRSQMDIGSSFELDLDVRAVDGLPLTNTPSYVEADARLGWQVTDTLEFSLVGRNLLDAAHLEIGVPGVASEVRRSFYLTARASF